VITFDLSMAFDVFWARYPRRESKKDARKAWDVLKPTPELVEHMLEALRWQIVSEQWTKADGQFIPLPATYLRGERWQDQRQQERRGHAWTFDCPHSPHCRTTGDCVMKRKTA